MSFILKVILSINLIECVSKEDFNKDKSINQNKQFNCLNKKFGQDLNILEVKINNSTEEWKNIYLINIENVFLLFLFDFQSIIIKLIEKWLIILKK